MKKQIGIYSRLLTVLALVAASLVQAISFSPVGASQITDRSLQLIQGADAANGGSIAGALVKHQFTFTLPTAGTVGSIKFEYCTLAAGTCTLPTGLVTTAATLGDESLSAVQGFSIDNTTNGAPYLTRTASAITASDVAILRLDSITNPTAVNQTFFVRISTFASTDTTGGATDTGTVAASTADPIVLSGTMPESLVFCTGATVSTTALVPDCSTATSGAISFNQLFSPTDTATATSQMAASTNAGFGYAITVNGPTLTSGSNTVAPMSTAVAGVKGIGQFGINLKANTVATSTIAIGTEIDPVSNGTNYRGQALVDYNAADTFKFASGDSVADSSNGGAGGTDAQIYTASYIVNVPGSQPAGTYTTTLTYICTPKF